jgi:DNA-directed RNA polymerase specialized sigma24 family protein
LNNPVFWRKIYPLVMRSDLDIAIDCKRILQKLPEDQKAIIRYYVEGYNQMEIAFLMPGYKQQRVGIVLRQCMAKLQKKIGKTF